MDSDELKKLGFKDFSTKNDNEVFTDYRLVGKGISIDITGITLVEIIIGHDTWITVPNCKTIDDIKELIRLFNIEKR